MPVKRTAQERMQAARRLPLRLRSALWAEILTVATASAIDHWAREAAADLVRAPADSPWRRRIACALAIAWPRLSPDARQRLATLRQVRGLFGELASAASPAADSRLLLGLVVAAADAPAPALIGLLPEAFAAESARRAAAKRSLCTLALAWSALPVEGRSALDAAIVAASRIDEALSDGEPLLAALAPPKEEAPAIAAWLVSDDEAGLMALRTAVRRLAGSAGQRWALRLAREPAVCRAAVETLASSPKTGRGTSPQTREHLLQDAHLLLAPRRRKAIRDAGGRIWRAWLEETATSALAAHAPGDDGKGDQGAVSACVWTALAAPPLQRRRFFAAALTAPAPRARRFAVRALADEPSSDGPGESLDDFAFDQDARVARTACLAVFAADRVRGERLRRRLLRSPHASIRALCAALATLAPQRWRDAVAAGAASDALASASLRLDLALDRVAALADLREAASQGEADSRIASIRLAVRAGVVDEIELELLRMLAGPPPGPEGARLSATAVAALGRLDTGAARETLARFARHPDDRIRANALEALGRSRAGVDALRGALSDGAPRARANAVASLLELAPADGASSAALTEMLESSASSAALKRSALWVIERRGLVQRASQVAAIAADPSADLSVRRRARRCARRLLARMASAPAVEQDRAVDDGERP